MLLPSVNPLEDARTQVESEGELVLPAALRYTSPDYIHLSMIATNIVVNQTQEDGSVTKSSILLNLETFTESLLNSSTGSPLHLIFITDKPSQAIIQHTIRVAIGRQLSKYVISRPAREELSNNGWKFPRLKVEYVDFEAFVSKHREKLDGLKDVYCPSQEFKILKNSVEGPLEFGMKCGEKYRRDLFYLSAIYHEEYPDTLDQIIVFDIDLTFRVDLSELQAHFNHMKKGEMIAAGKEFSFVYKTLSVMYRDRHYLGFDGLNQGLNTGVVLMDLKKLRSAGSATSRMFSAEFSKELSDKYSFFGVSGDQCMLTLLRWELPHVFYTLPCAFNNQNVVENEPPPPPPTSLPDEEDDEYEVVDMLTLILDGKPSREEFRHCEQKKITHHNGSNL